MSTSSIILHKRSSSVGAVPALTSLSAGEIAINTNDGKMFIRTSDDVIKEFINTEYQPFVLDQ